jgi:hypothetical protein
MEKSINNFYILKGNTKMDERTNAMELVNENEVEEFDGYAIDEAEDSDEAGIDLSKMLKWIGIGVTAVGVVAVANRKKIKAAIRKKKEKLMRKYAEQLGYDIVNPDDYVGLEYEDYEDNTCESNEG